MLFGVWRRLLAALSVAIYGLALSAILSSATAQSATQAKRVALVAGVDRYENLPAERQLQKAVNDARAIRDVLGRLGFQVVALENPGRVELLRRWQELLNALVPGDEAAFYFAGHGVEIAGSNYLVPADVPKLGDGEAEVLKGSAIRLDALLDGLRERGPRVSLIILDACRDNPFATARSRSVGRSRGLADAKPPQGTFIMYSAGAGQQALDGFGDGDSSANSIYTRALLPLLETPGLDITELARRVRRDVHEQTQRVGHVQTPAYYDEIIGQFCPVSCDGKGAAPASEPIASAAASTAEPSVAAPLPTREIKLPDPAASPFDGTYSVQGASKTCPVKSWSAKWRIAKTEVLNPRGDKIGMIDDSGNFQLRLPSLVKKGLVGRHRGQVRDGKGSGRYEVGNCGGIFTMARDG